MTATRRVLLWGGEARPAAGDAYVVSWDGAGGAGTRSLVDYLEANSAEIRARYLAWAHELGEHVVDGKPLRETFAFADGVNPWALSVFVEQSPWRQKSVEALLKVMAFERLLDHEPAGEVRYCGPDAALGRVLGAVCAKRGVPFTFESAGSAILPAASLRHRLPQVLQGLLGLVYVAATRLPLRRQPPPCESPRRRVLLCAPYFSHNGREAAAQGFESRYWTVLPALLEAGGYSVTWLHSFYAHDAVPDVASAQRQIRGINESQSARGRHYLLESFLTARGWCRVAARWWATARRSLAAGRKMQSLDPYWPLLEADWSKAFRGAGCLENLLYAECYRAALASLPRQDEGLYLMECQGWERALIGAWRATGHGRIAGSIHSTIRDWDLRYHTDPRRYAPGVPRLPAPDVVVVNGRQAARQYLSTASQREPVLEAEALRYLHLARIRDSSATRAASSAISVLILGDYLRQGTEAVMRLVESACALEGDAVDVRVKPHPNCPVDPAAYPRLRFSVVGGDVMALARESHVVISGNLTSAAVDAYVGGARVLVLDDGRGINYSPLRGQPGVAFVRDAAQVRALLGTTPTGSGDNRADFFHLDGTLPRWRRHFDIEHPREGLTQ